MTGTPAENARFVRPPDGLADGIAWRYLDLLAKCLTREVFEEKYVGLDATRGRRGWILARLVSRLFSPFGLEIVRDLPQGKRRDASGGWPLHAETMAGSRRLEQVARAIADVIRCEVPGDLLEAGVWRGGTVIFMRGCLEAFGDRRRSVWVADSFQGLPQPDAERFPHDRSCRLWTLPYLAVPVETVQANFARYGLLDDRVRFLPGWFRDTLRTAAIDRLSVLRIDADMYESTKEALECLYPKLAPGGYLIVDDYGVLPACQAAVDDYRRAMAVNEPLERIDQAAVFWRRR
jgi:O-methyltransferase